MKVRIYDNKENIYAEVEVEKIEEKDIFFFTIFTKNGSVTYDTTRYRYEIL